MTQSSSCEQVTEQDDTLSSGDEDESSHLYELANSILAECKDATSLSDLNTTIYLFQEALNLRPALDASRSESLRDLAAALVTRYSLINQHQDLDQAISLCGDWYEILTRTGRQSLFDVRVHSSDFRTWGLPS
jgi:hypothetical protein